VEISHEWFSWPRLAGHKLDPTTPTPPIFIADLHKSLDPTFSEGKQPGFLSIDRRISCLPSDHSVLSKDHSLLTMFYICKDQKRISKGGNLLHEVFEGPPYIRCWHMTEQMLECVFMAAFTEMFKNICVSYANHNSNGTKSIFLSRFLSSFSHFIWQQNVLSNFHSSMFIVIILIDSFYFKMFISKFFESNE
jgi:hypothetical protein